MSSRQLKTLQRQVSEPTTPPRTVLKVLTKSVLNNLSAPLVRPVDTQGVRYVFVVGCGHSGTSLMAGRLGLHPEAWLVPHESRALLPAAGLNASRTALLEWNYVAQHSNRSVVIEKTPKHVHYERRIRRLVPEAEVAFVSRNPLDTVASLFKRTADLRFATDRWLLDTAAGLDLVDAGRAVHMRFEDLTQRPGDALRSLTDALDLEWNEELLTGEARGFSGVGQPTTMQLRANQVSQPIKPNRDGWRTTLDEDQAARVREATTDLESRRQSSRSVCPRISPDGPQAR